MILMKEYVSLTTAVTKMGERHFYSDHSNDCQEEKKASLGNSMLIYLGYVALTSWIFLKFLPVVGIKEIWKSWKHDPLTPSGLDFMAAFKNDKLMTGGVNFLLK